MYGIQYTISHFFIGLMLPLYPVLIVSFMYLYQCGQLLFNKRVFLDKGIVLDGNTSLHTIRKICEYVVGGVVSYVYFYVFTM